MSVKNLMKSRLAYKPFDYPWCYDAWLKQQQIHWLPQEVPMTDDVNDYKNKLTETEKNLLTQIFRFFTQADLEVGNCYNQHYSRVFKPYEVQMMLTSFSAMETVHVAAYSHLIDTLGLPEIEYSAFMDYKEMKDKYDYMQGFNVDDRPNIAKTMAVFGGFTEGLQLFASFAMLLNFPRFNKMKGMGQIITWSVRDETLHTNSVIRLYHEFLKENSQISIPKLHKEISEACKTIVEHEDKFIDLAFSLGPVQGMSPNDIKLYIRYIADLRLEQLGVKKIYNVGVNPLTWLDEQLNAVEHMNFFEGRSTEYSKGASTGSWDDAFDD